MNVFRLGTVDYTEAYDLQKRTVRALQEGTGHESLFLLEHPHVVTKGRNATGDAVIATPELFAAWGATLVETDRGGDVTYHGPGQLVGYPIMRLEDGRRDIRRYVNDLEETLIRTLKRFSVEGTRHPEHRGVWVDNRKIASVGVRISRWVTSHGFALNVTTDLKYFSLIHPCGIRGCEMTSLQRETEQAPGMDAVIDVFTEEFASVYQRSLLQPATRD